VAEEETPARDTAEAAARSRVDSGRQTGARSNGPPWCRRESPNGSQKTADGPVRNDRRTGQAATAMLAGVSPTAA